MEQEIEKVEPVAAKEAEPTEKPRRNGKPNRQAREKRQPRQQRQPKLYEEEVKVILLVDRKYSEQQEIILMDVMKDIFKIGRDLRRTIYRTCYKSNQRWTSFPFLSCCRCW